ncbi:hypothetical protein WJX73_006080 [Symbiochloris irregularis]|uniref:Uncharacterized protein n=1 Tax=Symbiochloris irregularis TaxID=706552 RepID=A0AAW1PLM6_9CHLO
MSGPTAKIATALQEALREPSARERVPEDLPAYPAFAELARELVSDRPDLAGISVSIAPATGMSNLDKQRTQLKQLLGCALTLMEVCLLENL